MGGANNICTDKTGTLTTDTPHLVNATALHALEDRVKQQLATLAGSSAHPISKSLSEILASRLGIRPVRDATKVEEIPGQGLRTVDAQGRVWTLSKPTLADTTADVEFRCNENLIATFEFEDTLRDGGAFL